MQFEHLPHPAPVPSETRDAILQNPGFGTTFTDHMVVIDYDADKGGWHKAVIGPRGPISLDPAAAVLHYGLMKAFPPQGQDALEAAAQ